MIFYKRFLHKLSHILVNLTEKKIKCLHLSDPVKCRTFIEKYYEMISEICFKFAISIEELLEKNIIEFKAIVKTAFKLVQVNFVKENMVYKEEKMKFYV